MADETKTKNGEAKEEIKLSKEELEEELEVQSYMDNAGGYESSDWIAYLKVRYEQIKEDYKNLSLQRKEFEMQKREDLLTRLSELFRQNYKARKWAVHSLRQAGEQIDDKYVLRVG